MSCTAVAYTVIGVRLNHDQLYEKAKIRECECELDEEAILKYKFCPLCGKQILKEEETPIDDNIDVGMERFHEFEIVSSRFWDMKKPLYYIGHVVRSASFYSDKPNLIRPEECADLLKTVKSSLKEKLEPLKLWNEQEYGVWTVLYHS